MNIMKKIFFALATAAAALMALVACEKQETILPEISFKSALPTMEGDIANFILTVKDYNSTDAVEVPVVFGGDAVKDVDYSVSAEKFVIGGPAPVMTIKVTPIVYGSGKKVTLKLQAPAGFKIGQYALSEAGLAPKIGYASFEVKKSKLTDLANVEIGLYDDNGKKLKVNQDAVIGVSINEKSTAVEGTNFQFKGEKQAVIKAGSSVGTVQLEIIGEPDPEKDLIVLNLEPGNKFDLGQNATAEIKILGSILGKLEGSWSAKAFVTDEEYMRGQWFDGVSENSYAAIPKFNAEDSFLLNLTEGIFQPDFKSQLKDYFIGESKVAHKGKIQLRTSMGEKIDLELFELDNTNRYFSPEEKSEDKVSLIGIRMIEEEGQDVLDLYIIDYTSTAFLTEFADYGMYGSTKPVAKDTGVYLNYTFKKAAE